MRCSKRNVYLQVSACLQPPASELTSTWQRLAFLIQSSIRSCIRLWRTIFESDFKTASEPLDVDFIAISCYHRVEHTLMDHRKITVNIPWVNVRRTLRNVSKIKNTFKNLPWEPAAGFRFHSQRR